ncbi:MAG: hypothetical protein HY855_14890 [Burkholderiales bacterium]|nr:hypothetical protein [Burkholderiales bacterium]
MNTASLTPLLSPLLGLAWLALASPAAAQTMPFPIDYSGHLRLTVTVKNSHGAGLCAEDGALDITLQPGGRLDYRVAELETRLEAPTGQPPTCSIRPTGKTNQITGTHDGRGSFSVPSGTQGIPPLNGSFDADHIQAEYSVGPSHISFNLPAVGHRIALEPDPSLGFQFHRDLLEGKGFKLVLRDPQGRDHLDYNSFKLIVGPPGATGTDTTAHFMGRLLQGVVPMRDESPDSRTRVIHLLPDPAKLMQGHDLFAIPFNGEWRIELRICDQARTCFNAVYDKVYFGPFLTSAPEYNVVDGRCATPADPVLQVKHVMLGNTGVDSPRTALYLGLATPSLTDLWTYFFDDFGDGTGRHAWWQGRTLPFLAGLNLPSGTLIRQDPLLLPDWVAVPTGSGPAALRKQPFPGGDYRFIMAALDTGTGAFRMDVRAVPMCNR